MVSSITSALMQRTTDLRRLTEQTTGQNAKNNAQIALFDERVQQNLDALDKVGRSRVDVAKQRKELAKQRLEQLKQRLRLLRMMGGSPQAVARQAAAIAKEVASLAREFAAAGNAGTGGWTPENSSETSATTDTGANTDDNAAPAATPDASIAAETAPTATSAATADDPSKDETTAASPTQHAATKPGQDSDRQFFRDAQDLVRQTRKVIEQAAQRARTKRHGNGNVAEILAADRQAASAEREITTLAAQKTATPIISIKLTI